MNINKFSDKEQAERACQTVFIQKNPNLGKFMTAKKCQVLENFVAVWKILQSFVIINGQVVYFVVI
jgi:hypothetical protein